MRFLKHKWLETPFLWASTKTHKKHRNALFMAKLKLRQINQKINDTNAEKSRFNDYGNKFSILTKT